jgi:Putative transposase/Transposase zinc-binding domain
MVSRCSSLGIRQPGAPCSYERRRPEEGVLFRVLDEHLDGFLNQAAVAADDERGGVPGFVQNELRDYLACGVLSRGFARFKCTTCPSEHLVPLSCKGRGFCPSCGGKRMTSLASELTDRVIPFVPVRQFVLSLPHRMRYGLAYDHDKCIAVLRIYIRALLGFYRGRARKTGVHDGRSGTVTFIQRFGSAANLNIHFHVIALDGVFAEDKAGELTFHAAGPLNDAEVTRLVGNIRRRILRHVERRGLLDADCQDDDPLVAVSPALASCYAGSIGSRQSLGRRRGARLERIGADPDAPWIEHKGRLSAHVDGFDLHAGLRVVADNPGGREQLEKVLRYCARPALSEERLRRVGDKVHLRLKAPWRDGTTHMVYEAIDFVAKLAALVPRPHKNLVLYHGVLSANAAWRARVVLHGRDAAAGSTRRAS